MSGGLACALAGCLLAAFVVYDLVRGETGFSSFTFTRARQPVRYWAYLGFVAWVAGLAFLGAVRMGGE